MELVNSDAPKVLAVDLDNSLSRTDALIEGLWSALRKNPIHFLKLVLTLRRGIACFKRRIALETELNVSSIPFNSEVLSYINTWKEEGGKAILVTASDQSIANEVGEFLGVFDQVHGSNGKESLKGAKKAKFLCDQFGANGFAYIGDSNADMKVWEHANLIITVNPSRRLKNLIERRFQSITHIEENVPKWKSFLRLIRPHQWIKNGLVFVPVLAAHLNDFEASIQSAWTFVVFSVVASAIYVLNDAFDVQHDREHPEKRNRPIASGHVQIPIGIGLSALLLIIGLTMALHVELELFWMMCLYVLLNLLYSAFFKQIVISDLVFLSVFYVLRIFAGSATSGVELSFWLIAFASFFFFALGSLKRLSEIVLLSKAGKAKVAGRGYHASDRAIISQMATASAFTAVAFLALYMNSENVVLNYSNPKALWALVFLLTLWFCRLIILTNRGEAGDPWNFLMKDRASYFYLVLGVIITQAAAF